MKFLSNLISNLASALFIILILGFLIFSIFSQKIELVNFRFFLVQSGSMMPSISTGDIILVNVSKIYQINDVVTFTENDGRIVTHRIVGKKDNLFITKGDANRIADNSKISISNILGKVVFILPKIGYLVDFSKSEKGLLFFIVIPGVILIFSQLKHFFK